MGYHLGIYDHMPVPMDSVAEVCLCVGGEGRTLEGLLVQCGIDEIQTLLYGKRIAGRLLIKVHQPRQRALQHTHSQRQPLCLQTTLHSPNPSIHPSTIMSREIRVPPLTDQYSCGLTL